MRQFCEIVSANLVLNTSQMRPKLPYDPDWPMNASVTFQIALEVNLRSESIWRLFNETKGQVS